MSNVRPPTVRVMTYNIHHGVGLDGHLDLDRIARTIVAANVDLVALQEVDRLVPRSGTVDQAAELGRLTAMHAVFGRSIALGSGEYGNALLSRWPLTDVRIVPLPNPRRREQRTILAARVVPPANQPLYLLATHYDHAEPATRRLGAEATLALAAQYADPTLLLGDLNAEPGSPTLRTLAAAFRDAASTDTGPTFPADVPTRRIDHVLLSATSSLRAIASQVADEAVASDHRPLVVTVGLR